MPVTIKGRALGSTTKRKLFPEAGGSQFLKFRRGLSQPVPTRYRERARHALPLPANPSRRARERCVANQDEILPPQPRYSTTCYPAVAQNYDTVRHSTAIRRQIPDINTNSKARRCKAGRALARPCHMFEGYTTSQYANAASWYHDRLTALTLSTYWRPCGEVTGASQMGPRWSCRRRGRRIELRRHEVECSRAEKGFLSATMFPRALGGRDRT
jgi:hypothetical protein